MSSLDIMRCTAFRGGEQPLTREEIEDYLPQVPDWKLVKPNGSYRIERSFRFSDFAKALEFTNRIGLLAEKEGHHPAVLTEWGRVTVSWWTHRIRGLHRNDFIMAAKSEKAYRELQMVEQR
jgi:4a-hydroxytetrahydrobiopterin dehydratase